MAILVLIEHQNGQVKKTSLEAVGQARKMAQELSTNFSIAIAGNQIKALGLCFNGSGAEKIYLVSQSELADYSSDGYTQAFHEIVKAANPDLIFIGASSFGKDVAPRLAARLGGGYVSDCTGMVIQGEEVVFTRPVYAGKALAKVRVTKKPVIVTLRPNVFPIVSLNGGGTPPAEDVKVTLNPIRTKVVERKSGSGAKLELTEAEIIVSGGRGMKGSEHFHLVEELASAIGGAVGASRAVVDAGWRPHEYQVGQTGKTVSPQVYIACGISGAIQHLAGMSSSKYIIAINKDADAPIFKMADLGIVGDVFEILPLLSEAIKKAKSS